MIGSHNSMTYLSATSRLWNLLSPWWRCQERTLADQIADGVRWFDLRVTFDAATGRWHWAHGHVDLGIADVIQTLDIIGECGGTCRIMLEHGSTADEHDFLRTFCASSFLMSYPQVTAVARKCNWCVYFSREHRGIIDRSFVPYHRNRPWWRQLRTIITFPFTTIRKQASCMRPTQEEADDTKNYYVYDYAHL